LAGKFRTALNVTGKGAKDRVVPINDRLAIAVNEWGALVGHTGLIARAVSKSGAIRDRISAIGIFEIVRSAGESIGKPELAPHDLRRTYAQLGYEAGVSIIQISKLLGHASVCHHDATVSKFRLGFSDNSFRLHTILSLFLEEATTFLPQGNALQGKPSQ
jgi:integrase